MSDFSHIPEIDDKFPIEPPVDNVLKKILGTIGDFFSGLGRKIDHIFSSHYCECIRFAVSLPVDVTIPAFAGVGAAIGKQFKVTADFSSDGTECACCQYRQFVRGYAVQLGVRVAGPQIYGGNLDPVKFREDGYADAAGRLRPRGHRQDPGKPNDQYSPTQATGCHYESEDTPQCPVGQELHLEFLGMIIDTCEGRVIELRTWKVDVS
jgi:hypothetical protein